MINLRSLLREVGQNWRRIHRFSEIRVIGTMPYGGAEYYIQRFLTHANGLRAAMLTNKERTSSIVICRLSSKTPKQLLMHIIYCNKHKLAPAWSLVSGSLRLLYSRVNRFLL